MDTNKGLSRQTKYALMSGAAAAVVSSIMLSTFLDSFNWIFVPSVAIMVFISAYFAFRRQMRNKGALNGRRIFGIAFEVGTLSHFYTFALYFPLDYFINDFRNGVDGEIVAWYFASILIVGIISIIMFVWIAIPMYMGIGYIQKAMENDISTDMLIDDESILDSMLEMD